MTIYDDKAGISERLAKAIDDAGGCQVVAERVGTSYQAIYWWLTGKNIPGATSLARFCRAFQVSADWILLGEKPK